MAYAYGGISFTTLIIWKNEAGETQVLQFDIVRTETHEALVEVTDHPVEEGPDVSEHARPGPARLSIEGLVGNHPLWRNPGVERYFDFEAVELDLPENPSPPLFRGAVAAVRGLFAGSEPRSATVLKASEFHDRIQEMAESLEELRLSGRLCKIETAFRTYSNMLITREAEPLTVETGLACVFQVEFKSLTLVKTETVAAPAPAEARGAQKGSKGSKGAEVDAQAEKKRERAKSVAAQLFDGAAGGFSF